ncbi:MAG: TfuA-like protein [Pseudomonadota bacterium]|nr:TfuA-like protein [Pseudomonadota bacterium]
MNIIIFTGPTLPAEEVKARLDARCLPPVKYGDVYRAVTLFKPRVIGIIDGYFNQVPAVWHKEILWALGRGVRVFGAASMGALRAAELDRFGMQGVGAIYTAYRDGRFPPYADEFENDDEVAVIHGPPELGFPAASEALVNIRATLAGAARAGIITGQTRDELVRLAKTRFYAERSFDSLLQDAEAVPGSELAALNNWLPANRIDQKRLDALLLLRQLAAGDEQSPPDFRFEHTTLWENATREMEQVPVASSPMLDELRLLGKDYFALRDSVLAETFREERAGKPGQHEEAPDAEAWHHAPLRDREMATYRETAPPHWLARQMLARLRESGDLATLEARAADKREKLARRNLPHAADLSELDLLQLMDWYFSELLGMELPHDTDAYAAQLGHLHPDELHDLALREYFYQHPET